MKHDTPPWPEHVPLRVMEQLYELSLQTAVAVPHGAEIGADTEQMLDPGGGVGGVGLGDGDGFGVGVGAGAPVTSRLTSGCSSRQLCDRPVWP